MEWQLVVETIVAVAVLYILVNMLITGKTLAFSGISDQLFESGVKVSKIVTLCETWRAADLLPAAMPAESRQSRHETSSDLPAELSRLLGSDYTCDSDTTSKCAKYCEAILYLHEACTDYTSDCYFSSKRGWIGD